jgi:hypothetical protein
MKQNFKNTALALVCLFTIIGSAEFAAADTTPPVRTATVLQKTGDLNGFKGTLDILQSPNGNWLKGVLATTVRDVPFQIPLVQSRQGIEGSGSMKVVFTEAEGGSDCPLTLRMSLVGNSEGQFDIFLSYPSLIPKDIWSCQAAQESAEQTKLVTTTAWLLLLAPKFVVQIPYVGANPTTVSPGGSIALTFNVKNSDASLAMGYAAAILNIAKPATGLATNGAGPYLAWPEVVLSTPAGDVTWKRDVQTLSSVAGEWTWQPSAQAWLMPRPRLTDGTYDYFAFATAAEWQSTKGALAGLGASLAGTYTLKAKPAILATGAATSNLWAGNFQAAKEVPTQILVYPVAKKVNVLFGN